MIKRIVGGLLSKALSPAAISFSFVRHPPSGRGAMAREPPRRESWLPIHRARRYELVQRTAISLASNRRFRSGRFTPSASALRPGNPAIAYKRLAARIPGAKLIRASRWHSRASTHRVAQRSAQTTTLSVHELIREKSALSATVAACGAMINDREERSIGPQHDLPALTLRSVVRLRSCKLRSLRRG